MTKDSFCFFWFPIFDLNHTRAQILQSHDLFGLFSFHFFAFRFEQTQFETQFDRFFSSQASFKCLHSNFRWWEGKEKVKLAETKTCHRSQSSNLIRILIYRVNQSSRVKKKTERKNKTTEHIPFVVSSAGSQESIRRIMLFIIIIVKIWSIHS